MGIYTVGTLTTVAVTERPDLVAPHVLELVVTLGIEGQVGVVEIDPELSDTAATQAAYGLAVEQLVNCVIVSGKRDGEERIAACLVTANSRADVNSIVKKRLDVRKASFLPRESAVELSGMEFGAITPIGLPAAWPILIDSAVVASDIVLIGSGIRKSKIVIPGALLATLPGAEIIDGLGKVIAAA